MTTPNRVIHQQGNSTHISCTFFLSKSAPLSYLKLKLVLIYLSVYSSFCHTNNCRYFLDFKTLLWEIFKHTIWYVKLGSLDWLGNFCGVYLPYLEQYTWRLIISLESAVSRSLNSYDDNLQTIPGVNFSSKNFGINWRRPNLSNTSIYRLWSCHVSNCIS